MSTDPPAGHTWRRPPLDDAEAIYDLVAARNTAIIGFPDFTVDDVRDELEAPGFDPATDGWLVRESGGALVGYGWACRKSDSNEIDIDAVFLEAAVGERIWSRVLARVGALGAELGHGSVEVDIGIYRADEGQRQLATAHSFTPGTTFHRMRADHDGPPDESELPDGVEVRVGENDPAFRRQALDIMNAATAGQFGYVERGFDEWHESVDSSSTHDWSQLRVAYLDGEPVGKLQGNDQFVEDEACGYVQRVAVLEAARGRGIARLLLRQAFAADARRGRKGTILHVDTNNPTPALNLYLSVGMRPVLVIDVWRRPMSTA